MKTKEQRKQKAWEKYEKECNEGWKKYKKIQEPDYKKYKKKCEEIDAKPEEIPNEIMQNGIKYCKKCGSELK